MSESAQQIPIPEGPCSKVVRAAFQQMVEKWPSSVVARTEVERFTGGAIKEKYLANLDCQGKGPKGRVRLGRKIIYPVHEFLAWLESRAKAV
jgi:hypothetical protein